METPGSLIGHVTGGSAALAETRGLLRQRRRALLVFAVVAVAVLAALAAGRVARRDALAEQTARAEAALPLATAALAGVIEKQRLIPLVLSLDAEVRAHLAAPGPAAEARLDARLKAIAADSQSAVIYLVNRSGRAVAASNAGTPTSFVGSDYAFRRYFQEAMADGTAAQYALGTVSGRPGLYLSRRVDGPAGPLGVVVVKVEFDALEAQWRESGFVVQVANADGVVLVTSVPDWRFHTLHPPADPAAAAEALQLGDVPLRPLPLEPDREGLTAVDLGSGPADYVSAAGPVGSAAPGWTLTLLAPVDGAATAAARTAGLTVLLAVLLLALLAAALVRRRRTVQSRQAALAAMNAELERRVALRTAELSRTNAALATEIAEREQAETRARHLREELAQANRLSILGQIAAGVAHEINQPVAAIRTFAENGTRLIAADRPGDAGETLGSIVRMTERIGEITGMLRSFARRQTGLVGPVAVEQAIDGALALLSGRIRDTGVTITRERAEDSVTVLAGRIRLEQILVNLLQNALDALADHPDPTITIDVSAAAETVAIAIGDNGPGLDPEIRRNLFMPFATTKPAGLGLGLVISSDIATEFGGSLRLGPETGAGTCFTLELRRPA